MPRAALHSLLFTVLLATSAQGQTASRYVIYLHGRIVEEAGRHPTDPVYGIYEYDAILDSLRHAGFVVLSDQRPRRADSDSFAARVVQQIDSLLRHGVRPRDITVVGFSKGGWIAILASSRLQNPDVHVSGRLLSLYETSDSLGVSCDPMFAHRTPGSSIQEISLSLGLGHGTFFQPRPAWLLPTIAWAGGREP
jgi:hypothetical protein